MSRLTAKAMSLIAVNLASKKSRYNLRKVVIFASFRRLYDIFL